MQFPLLFDINITPEAFKEQSGNSGSLLFNVAGHLFHVGVWSNQERVNALLYYDGNNTKDDPITVAFTMSCPFGMDISKKVAFSKHNKSIGKRGWFNERDTKKKDWMIRLTITEFAVVAPKEKHVAVVPVPCAGNIALLAKQLNDMTLAQSVVKDETVVVKDETVVVKDETVVAKDETVVAKDEAVVPDKPRSGSTHAVLPSKKIVPDKTRSGSTDAVLPSKKITSKNDQDAGAIYSNEDDDITKIVAEIVGDFLSEALGVDPEWAEEWRERFPTEGNWEIGPIGIADPNTPLVKETKKEALKAKLKFLHDLVDGLKKHGQYTPTNSPLKKRSKTESN